MPQTVETNKKQHQNPHNHAVVTQLGFSTRPPVNMIKNLFKPEQVLKFDQPQKASEGAKPLCAGAINCRGIDFSGIRIIALYPV